MSLPCLAKDDGSCLLDRSVKHFNKRPCVELAFKFQQTSKPDGRVGLSWH